MPQAAVVAAALTDHSAHPYGLFVNGADYIRGTGGNAAAVPIETIAVEEQGNGGVSSMTFVIEDPTATVTIPDGSQVQFWNLNNGAIIFRGYVDHMSPQPAFGGQGAVIDVSCTGVEAWLDWITIGSLVYAWPVPNSFNQLTDMVAWLVATYAPAIYAPSPSGGAGTPMGNATYAIGSFLGDGVSVGRQVAITGFGAPFTQAYGHTFTNASLRSVIDQLILDSGTYQSSLSPTITPVWYTIDHMLRLRMFADAAGLQPDDYTTLTVSDTYASSPSAAALQHSVEYGDVIHEVYVTGGNAASSGYFSDGSGIRGRQGQVTDTTITTADAATLVARSFFNGQQIVRRGEFDLEDFTPSATVHTGSLVTLTDAATGATGTYRIASIGKTFNSSARENWHVTYGRVPPSVTQLSRRLTRSVPF